MNKIVTWSQLKEALECSREASRRQRLVFTNGCFDLLHVGHIRYLQAARRLGDLLIVGLNSDASVRRLKGDLRPILPQDERAEMLAALGIVNYVSIFDSPTPENLIRLVRPHLYVKGGDYAGVEIPEIELVRSLGGETILIPGSVERSTSGIIAEIRRKHDGPGG